MALAPHAVPLALYVHLPWCVRKCPYCDFNSHARDGAVPAASYVAALLADLDADLHWVQARPVQSIFIGGGTPSLFPGTAIAALMEGIRQRLDLAPEAEITLEANPGAVDDAHFHAYREAGINRLSIGIQSLREAPLRVLGRMHGVEDALRAVAVARRAGFDNLNLDLMYGLPGDRKGDTLRDLEALLALAPEHVSWYQLTIEAGTVYARKPPRLPPEPRVIAESEAGLAHLAAAGYARYEVSAYARAGREARHNLNYWTFGDYLGIGAGAHGKLTTPDAVLRTLKRRHPEAYMKEAGTAASRSTEVVPEARRITEFMLNALRLAHGFERTLFEARTGLPAARLAPAIAAASARGWLGTSAADRIIPTAEGYRFLNDLQLLFVA